MKRILLLLLVSSLLTPKAGAQQTDITGVWYGELLMNDTAGNPVELPYEIAVSEEKGKLTGYSRIVFHANGKEEPGIQNIELKWKGKQIVMEDEGFIEHQFSINPSRRVKKTMIVTLRETDREMIMEGTWSTNRTRYYIPAKGTVVLRRKLDFKKSELFKSLDTLKLVTKLSFKDRPELPPVTAMAPPPPPPPAPEPDLIIPALAQMNAQREPNTIPARVPGSRVTAMNARKKAQFDALARVPMKPAPVPVVTAAVTAPVKKDPPPPQPERKPAPQPKPAPPPPAKKTEAEQVAVQPPPPPEKKPVPAAPKPVPPPLELAAPSAAKGAAEIDKRITRTDQSFYFQSDSLVLTLYDNGEVDGDTVTVLMNGNVLFSKAGLDIKPNTKTLYITPTMDSVKLVMYAESLGEIPPNTGLLIVNDGDKRYEVRFSADLKTNAGIVLRRKKEE